ncbi:MAG TPA: KamA family radical SAM protein [Pyrinomonadaceae bacterium]|nr:KamA family radical SAM protein [Pyrinomonadaceae bacterium]
MTQHVKYLTQLTHVTELGSTEQEELRLVTDKFALRSNEYYQQLIDWTNPDDPIRRLIIPALEELDEWGRLDASDERRFTVVPGLEHKYADTALLLVNDVCGGYCRFCFRKRLFMNDNQETVRDITQGLEYIRGHQEITDVLLTGGDPLMMSAAKLESIISRLRDITSVKVIRIGTKMPAFNPARIIDDEQLLEMIGRYSMPLKRIYIMGHFNHPRELTKAARKSLQLLFKAGAVVVNQTPLIRGVNSDPVTLSDLFNELSHLGVPSYYVFQCRPTIGNRTYAVPIEEAFAIFVKAQSRCSGLASSARFVMSHESGKVEVTGLTEQHIFMRYHRAANPQTHGRCLVFNRKPTAHWLDDYYSDDAPVG